MKSQRVYRDLDCDEICCECFIEPVIFSDFEVIIIQGGEQSGMGMGGSGMMVSARVVSCW